MKKPQVTVSKVNGDDNYSWAVLIDNEAVYTRLHSSECKHYKKLAQERVDNDFAARVIESSINKFLFYYDGTEE